jgi:predicted  nucleic acid-binding Zn-ribbon protein
VTRKRILSRNILSGEEEEELKDQLLLLAELQQIDNQIDQYQEKLARLPAEIKDIAGGLVTIRREIDERRGESTEIEKELRTKERELATEQDKIKRSERRLLQIKNQKEYNALSREVKLGKKVVAQIEETSLDFMTKIEALNKDVEKNEKLLNEMEVNLAKKKTESEQITKEAEKALTSLKTEREDIVKGIDRDFFKKYSTIRKARGNAVTEMNGGSCSGCHMAIPPLLGIKVLKQEEMVFCPNCQRMLYVKPENIPEYNKIE